MKTKSFLSGTAALALSALLFTSCNNDDTPEPAISSEYVTIAPSVTGEVITKANVAYGQQNDQLYLYYNTAGNNAADQSADFRFDGSIWDLGTKKMKWSTLHDAATGASELKFFATAPNVAPTTATSVEADQSTQANYKTSDLLVAYQSVAINAKKKYTALPIFLKHVLAKLTIELNSKALENPVITSIIIKDAITAYTIKYNEADNPATTTVSGDTKREVKPLTISENSLYTAILPAQNIQKTDGITIIIKTRDKSFTYQPDTPISLLQGKNTTLKLRLNGEGVTLGEVKVSDWGEGGTTEGNIEADPALP